MGLKAIDRRTWIKFLESMGLVQIRIKGGHEIWNHPEKRLRRPIVFQTTAREIPRMHLSTCLRTLEISDDEFMEKIGKL